MIEDKDEYVEEPARRREERGFSFLGWLAVVAGVVTLGMGALWLGWPVQTGMQWNLFTLVLVVLAGLFTVVMGFIASGSAA